MAAALHSAAQEGSSNIEFVENKGQWDSRIRFKGEVGVGSFFLESHGFSVLLYNPDDLARLTNAHHGIPGAGGGIVPPKGGGGGYNGRNGAPDTKRSIGVNEGGTAGHGDLPGGYTAGPADMIRSHAYRVSFVGANEGAAIIPDKPLPGYNNYFIGNDPSQWANHCTVYQGVTYQNIYPNIDIRYYTYNGQLKYDIIVHPGGDVNQIRMLYEGADQLSVKKNQLVVGTSAGPVTQLAPYSYQSGQQGRVDVRCKYSIRGGNMVSFKVDEYDPASTLVIDPSLVFCSFSGSKASNWGFTATPGPDGSFFMGGIVFNTAYPYTTGALQPVYGGGQFDVGILKLNSTGRNKVYATYIGGPDAETPHSLICDALGELIVLGRTYSGLKFPHTNTAGSGGGADMFVVKLDVSGGSLVGGMLIGGSGNDCVNMDDQVRSHNERTDTLIRNYGDDSRSEVIVDGSNNIFVAASSQSSGIGGAGAFPIVGAVFQPTFGGGSQDGVVLKINPSCNSIIWSSFLGGAGADAAFVLKPNPITGDIYVGGATSSINFPGDKSGVIQGAYSGGSCDGFVTVISSDGSTQKKMTYLGTNAADAIYGIQIDRKGFPYVMGTTNGSWVVTPNVGFSNPGAKQFISKMQPDLSAYVYSTVFGTASKLPNISPVAFLVDRCENVYVSGWGGWIIGGQADPYGLTGTAGMPVTPDAVKRLTDNRDFYFIVLQKNVSALLYGTYFGQDDNSNSISEHVDGGTSRYDQNGIIYQAICANCNGGAVGRYPTTPGVWSPANGAGTAGCNEVAVKISFNFAGVAAGLRASVNGRPNDTAGCVPLDTDLQDTIRNAKSYIWNFGDGGPDTATTSYDVSHTYNLPGRYRVMMVAIDSNTCNGRDTTYRYVIGRTDKAPVDFSYMKALGAPCTSLDYHFTNLSTSPPGKPFGPSSFIWDFGDNTAQVPLGFGPLDHIYQNAGTYLVKLILVDTAYCNWPDTAIKAVRVSPQAKAQFNTPQTGCAPYTAIFDNTSLGGLLFTWDFGDGSPVSTETNPTHLYATPGTYTVYLLEEDSTTCNKRDSTRQTITVSEKPTAAFTFAPAPPAANEPITFTNASIGGVKYQWSFGDGDTTIKTTMDTVQHLYLATDSFPVCLVTTNQFGCTDTVCHTVASLINPLLDVPNAFTPGRFGQNSVVKVMGFGITHMVFRIYNRWGKMVFESENPNSGWDGNVGGIAQPMDVYAYTLEAQFSNGKHVSKKGDITLIR